MNASDQRDGSSRVEREVLEILERAEAAQTPVENLQAAVRRKRVTARAQVPRPASPNWLLERLSPEIMRIAGALLLAIAAVAISDFSRLLAVVLAIASALAFFSLWLPSRTPGPGESPRWRGQDLRDPGSSSPFGHRKNWPKRPPT